MTRDMGTTDMTLRISPGLMLTSNQRLHWADRAKRTKAIRSIVFEAAAHDWPRFETPVVITAIIHPRNGRRSDAHNAQPTVKAAIDGLVDAGVLPGDDDDHLTRVVIIGGDIIRGNLIHIELQVAEARP